MHFANEDLEYLHGEKFSSDFHVKISTTEKEIPLRMDYIESIVKDENIIHIGCIDHIPLIKKKIDNDTWFHKRLSECSKTCLGIDINQEGIDYVTKTLGFKNIIYWDILQNDLPSVIIEQKWDYMVIGEVLEHVDDPVLFLKAIKNKYYNYVDRLILSVPNAFSLGNFINTLKHIERINPDHRYWFTPITLGKVVSQAKMNVESFQLCQSEKTLKRTAKTILAEFVLKKYPSLRDTIVMVVQI